MKAHAVVVGRSDDGMVALTIVNEDGSKAETVLALHLAQALLNDLKPYVEQ